MSAKGHLVYVGDLLCTSFLIIISDRDDVHLDTEIHMGKLHSWFFERIIRARFCSPDTESDIHYFIATS